MRRGKTGSIIFLLAFILYIFLGMYVSYPVTFDTNMFFGADNSRAYDDLANIIGIVGHYRVSVHPLFVLLAQPLVLLLNGIVNRPAMAVIICEAFCGALSVSLFYLLLKSRGVKTDVGLFFTAAWMCSFSMMIFSSVPETYIFACLGLISYWYLVSVLSLDSGKLSGKEYFLLVFYGVTSFGITLTNFASYCAGLAVLLLVRYDLKGALKRFFGINASGLAAVLILCQFQQFAWNQCPFFYKVFFSGVKNQNYEEFLYMDWSLSLGKTATWIRQTMVYPVLSSRVFMRTPEGEYHPILFEGYGSLCIKILFGLCLAFVAVNVGRLIFGIVRKRYPDSLFLAGVLLAYCGNLFLHYVYGSVEAFLYSAHYLFLFFILAAVSIDRICVKQPSAGMRAGMVLLIVCELANNLMRFADTACLALKSAGVSPDVSKSAKGALLCGGLLVILSGFCRTLRQGEKYGKNQKGLVGVFLRWILLYMAAVLTVTLFVAFNY